MLTEKKSYVIFDEMKNKPTDINNKNKKPTKRSIRSVHVIYQTAITQTFHLHKNE